MGVFSDRPYTSISVKVDQLVQSSGEDDDTEFSMELYLSELIHLIEVQPQSGSVEAARAIRKKIKYGQSVKEQLRALSLLELMVLNSGQKIGSAIASDEKLADVLRGIIKGSGRTGSGGSYDPRVRRKVSSLAVGWKEELEGLSGYHALGVLWKALPKARKLHSRVSSASSNVFDSSLDDVSARDLDFSLAPETPSQRKKSPPPRPSTRSPFAVNSPNENGGFGKKLKKLRRKKRSRKALNADDLYKIPRINYDVEAPKIRLVIADCHTHTAMLQNMLLTLPLDSDPFDDRKIMLEFDKCKSIRRKVLRYLQFVGAGDELTKSTKTKMLDEEFLGSLILANEQLVQVFHKFDLACDSSGQQRPEDNPNDELSESESSYYTDETSDEEDLPEEDEISKASSSSAMRGIDELTLGPTNEGSGDEKPSKTLGGKLPPPRPLKQKPLLQKEPGHKLLSRQETNNSTSSDPFGDKNEVSGNNRAF